MHITVLANRDLASNFALNLLLPALGQHQVTVFLSSRVGRAPPTHPDLAMLQFLEQTLFTELLFPALGARPGTAGLKPFAQLFDREPEQLNAVNSAVGMATLAASAPDLILSIRYGGILQAPAIALAPLGVLNLHSGILPDYRGVMATFRAMLDGGSHIGSTLHYIRDAGIDTGDVVAVDTLPLDPRHSYLANVLALYPGGCAMMAAAVAELAHGRAPPCLPQAVGGQYYSFPDAQTLARFHRQGCRLYDVAEITEFATRYLE